jgi:hypothetical protein
MDKKLKVFIYQEKDGKLLKDFNYSDVIMAINFVIDNNITENEKINLICSEVFPPKNMFYDSKAKTFSVLKDIDPEIQLQFSKIIKHVI